MKKKSCLLSLAFVLSFFTAAESTPAYAATLYYNNTVYNIDSHWVTLVNWWIDQMYADSSESLPANGDFVYIDGTGVYADLETPVALSGISVGEHSGGSGIELHGVTGDATFHGASFNEGEIVGDAEFSDDSYNGSNGSVTGDADFSESTYNEGDVGGSASFQDESYNGSGGSVGGSATFEDATYNEGDVSGDASFTGDSYNGSDGAVTGDAVFSESTYNEGTVGGDAEFSDSSYNGSGGSVGGNAAFSDDTYNEGAVAGDASFTGNSYNGSDGSIGGSILGESEPAPTSEPAVSELEPRRRHSTSPARRTANLRFLEVMRAASAESGQ